MSQALISSQDCCTACPDIPITQVPGPDGDDGTNGNNGTNGVDAFSTTTAAFVMPAISGTVTVDVDNSTWMAPGQIVFVENAGYIRVSSIPDAVSIVLFNLGYTGNVAPTTNVASGQTVSPGGLKGTDGTTPPTNTLNSLSPTTTKGDALIDNGANAPLASVVRLARGTDGTVLATDSAQATGRKQVALTPNAATDNVLPRFDASGDTTPTPLQVSKLLITDDGALQSTPTGGNARGSKAIDLQIDRAANTQVASGANSVIAGGQNNTASGAQATVAGGVGNLASGVNSAIGGGTANIASGLNSSVPAGATNTASGISSAVFSGNSNTASGQGSVACGESNSATATDASALGGIANVASGDASVVLGGFQGKAQLFGEIAHSSGKFVAVGDAQSSELIYKVLTTDATANVEAFIGPAGQRAVMNDFGSWAFHIIVVARNIATDLSAVWQSVGGVRRNAGPMTAIGTIVTTLTANDGEAWMNAGNVVVDADSATLSLRIRVTGAAATNIRWVAHARLVFVGAA